MDLLQAAFQHALAWTGSTLTLSLGYILVIGHRLPTGDLLFFMSALLNIAALAGACVGVARAWHLAKGAKSATHYTFRQRMRLPQARAAIRVRRAVIRRPAFVVR
jgi:ABC-type bacteriocin/lantibiotic exporter with double-glycine peptidase domain